MKEASVSRERGIQWQRFRVRSLQEATMFYVGLDIHDRRIAICVLGPTGQIVRRA
jgi:hypothetical protein